MAYNKSLEMRKIQPEGTYLGLYVTDPTKDAKQKTKIRCFGSGGRIKSRNGKTEYEVDKNGSFRKI